MVRLRRTFVSRLARRLRGIAACLAVLGLAQTAALAQERKVIVFVWDGLRPDSINPADTPNLHALREAGVEFTDNHSTYPTFTMMNAASFATGGFPGSTGYYGNTLWQPGAEGLTLAPVAAQHDPPDDVAGHA